MVLSEGVVFRIDPRLLQHRPPRLTLAATLNTLGDRVGTGELDAETVVDILDENRLLPYIIGDIRNLVCVASGQRTNASKIGDIIVSEECIRGTYELCLSFLKFISIILRSPDYIDTTKTMLASVTYIANEIYPNHHIWTYRDLSDMYKILSYCTEIFHQIIVLEPTNYEGLSTSLDRSEYHINNEKQSKNLSELKVVCIISLSQNQAHKQLLDVIVEGKQMIKKLIDDQNFIGEQTLQESQFVIYIRQSLAIFNKLLTGCDQVKSYLVTDGPQHKDTSDQTTSMTCIEKALFDTSIRPGLLQQLFGYVYQKDDNKTACISTDLIKTIAQKFTMSLMACLGSEADRVCEFFIGCLDGKEPKTGLEVAIMDLLSTCVRHQPGLIELFLNYKTDSSAKDIDLPKDKKHAETLRVVTNLLKQCGESSNSNPSLHTQVMKFVLTFWQKCHSAIEQFDKVENFWGLITSSLMKFVEADLNEVLGTQDIYAEEKSQNDKLNSYALMIIARELFNTSSGITERKLNLKLKERLDQLNSRNLMSSYSKFVTKRYTSLVSNLEKGEDYRRIMAAWRDFLTSYSKFKPFEISQQVKNQIVGDLLACLTIELRLVEKIDRGRIAFIGETLLMIWPRWIGKESSHDDLFRSIHELLYLADVSKEHLPFSFLLTFQTTVNLYLVRGRDYLLQSKRSFDLLVPALQIMQFELRIMEKFSNNLDSRYYKPGIESRLCQASIMTLRFIIDVARPHVLLWISYLKTTLKTDSLIQFLSLLMGKRIGIEVCVSLVELLLCLASIHQTADYLNKSDLLSQVNMIAVSAYEQPYLHLSQLAYNNNAKSNENGTTNKDSTDQRQSAATNGRASTTKVVATATAPTSSPESTIPDWLPIYKLVLRLNIEMVLTLGNEYISTAIEFISIHSIRICELIELLGTTKGEQVKGEAIHRSAKLNMDEVLQTMYLINQVLRRGVYMWKRRNSQTYQTISNEISKTASALSSHLAGNLSSTDTYTLAVGFCCSSWSLIRQFDAKESTKTKWQHHQQ